MKSIRLRAGKERSLLRRHPWVFEGSIAGGKADSGETVRVEAHDGRFLAWAAYSPQSTIRAARLELRRGRAHRRRLLRAGASPQALALARAPADRQRRRAPGPRRGRRPAGPDRRPLRRHAGGAVPVGRRRALEGRRSPTRCCRPPGCTRLYERTDASARERRRPAAGDRLAARRAAPTEADDPRARAGGSRSTSPSGHKTGFYLDQRDNRKLLRRDRARTSAASAC